MFEKKRKKKHLVEANIPPERGTQEDFDALVRTKKIEKDLPRHQKVKNLAKARLEERRNRGKKQADITRKDNTV